LPQVVWAYRGQYRVEDDWSRLKGRPLGLTPLYLQDEGRIGGLVYLLSLALRLLTLLEWVVRERLRQEGTKLQGVYAGQPGRKTARPSAELLLAAMKAISVSVVEGLDFPKDSGVGQKGVDSEGGGHRWPARPTPASSNSRPSEC
jgi:transposase